jgi:hypothetical protein
MFVTVNRDCFKAVLKFFATTFVPIRQMSTGITQHFLSALILIRRYGESEGIESLAQKVGTVD